MKKSLTIFLVIMTLNTHAQNWKEWTQQKKTQIKYLVNQIDALQIYASYLEKGYTIVKEGSGAIHNIKKGDFSLHQEYFNSLKKINPNIKSYWKVADIITLQIKIIQSCHKQRNVILQSDWFSPDEISYCEKVFTNLLNGCSDIIDQLIVLTTNGSLEMKDNERINRIDGLYTDMKEKNVFVQHFISEVSVLAMQRQADAGDISTLRALSGIRK